VVFLQQNNALMSEIEKRKKNTVLIRQAETTEQKPGADFFQRLDD
jgi:hypothetical protein